MFISIALFNKLQDFTNHCVRKVGFVQMPRMSATVKAIHPLPSTTIINSIEYILDVLNVLTSAIFILNRSYYAFVVSG